MKSNILTDKEVVEVHRLVERLYEKYPEYVVCSLTYSTNRQTGTTLPPEKEMLLNIYTPTINHNRFGNFEEFKCFVEQILADGIENVRIEILKDEIARRTQSKNDDIAIIERAQKELDKLEKK